MYPDNVRFLDVLIMCRDNACFMSVLKMFRDCVCVLSADNDGVDSSSEDEFQVQNPVTEKVGNITVTSALLDCHGRAIAICPANWAHADMWDTILCPSVLVSRRELLLLVAERMGAPRNVAGMTKVSQCDWYIGQHLTVASESNSSFKHYWGCGTYNCVGLSPGKWQKWQTWVEVEGHDGRGTQKTSRLAYIVCAVQLKNVEAAMGAPVVGGWASLLEGGPEDTVTFLLVRYASPHASVTRRGPEHRPLCPGPFQHTHCLWTWSTRPEGHERGCFRPRPWERHKKYFGKTEAAQDRLRQMNERAWYDLIQVTNIRSFANVQIDPDPVYEDTVFLQSLLFR